MEAGILILSLLLVVAGSVSALLVRKSITMPIVFVVAGVLLSVTGLLNIAPNHESVKTLTEATLVMLLFADASTLSVHKIQEDVTLPARLLGIGLPLTIACGGLVGWLLFPDQGIGFALLLATILAPTDAALGLPIFVNRSVPVRIRRALNVESGLNDGLVTPLHYPVHCARRFTGTHRERGLADERAAADCAGGGGGRDRRRDWRIPIAQGA